MSEKNKIELIKQKAKKQKKNKNKRHIYIAINS